MFPPFKASFVLIQTRSVKWATKVFIDLHTLRTKYYVTLWITLNSILQYTIPVSSKSNPTQDLYGLGMINIANYSNQYRIIQYIYSMLLSKLNDSFTLLRINISWHFWCVTQLMDCSLSDELLIFLRYSSIILVCIAIFCSAFSNVALKCPSFEVAC